MGDDHTESVCVAGFSTISQSRLAGAHHQSGAVDSVDIVLLTNDKTVRTKIDTEPDSARSPAIRCESAGDFRRRLAARCEQQPCDDCDREMKEQMN